MCTFVANDLDDLERDRVNHPQRPLPSSRVTPPVAAVLYFGCLGASLFTTRHFVDTRIAFWYYALTTLAISYRYVVEALSGLKAPYVATLIAVPVLIVAASYPDDKRLSAVAGSVFLFAIGRELCMDVLDRAGDARSFMHRFRAHDLSIVAFAFQTSGLAFLLVSNVRRTLDVATVTLMAVVLLTAAYYWFSASRHRVAVQLMKVEFFLGLYFLV